MADVDEPFGMGEALWIPGVDYVGGWRDAAAAGAELVAALSAAWPEAGPLTAVAQSAPDSTGVVRLYLPAATAQALAELLRAAA
ncbi:hypothetical protein [Actinacidiphila bryophytorum]|uniref:hypothetical protein n=1 Tax=Actinacidiphila bryophytorum TaxID=1436133 RepID=UPI002176D4A8|nr:hypothetical protein [Actinacidiphila bryophytorum]UWE10824.1 hypothetical protein NYE86_20320 [Actinacidiphila bryophytorum]